MKKVLSEAKKRNQLVSVYLKDSENFSVGLVDAVTDKHVRLRAVTKFGEFDGYKVRALKQIQAVSVGGKYEKKILVLLRAASKIENIADLSKDIIDTDTSLLYSTLVHAQNLALPVTMWLVDESSMLGFVKKISKTQTVLHALDEYGESNGDYFVATEEITDVDCDNKMLRCLKVLHCHKKSPKALCVTASV